MTRQEQHALGKVLFEARIRDAWGRLAQSRIDLIPWPDHIAADDFAAEHLLAMAQVKALLKTYEVTPR